MPTNVIMPQMGESIAEGTLTKWLKKPGDAVKRDEPLFEISTDKVDAEIPAPASGTLLEILVPEGQTVPINTVVARLGEAGEKASAAAPPAAAPERFFEGSRDGRPRGTGTATRCTLARAFSEISRPPPAARPFLFRSPSARRVAGGAAEAALVAGRPRDRGGEGRRHLEDPGHGHLGPRDEAGHRGVSGRSAASHRGTGAATCAGGPRAF